MISKHCELRTRHKSIYPVAADGDPCREGRRDPFLEGHRSGDHRRFLANPPSSVFGAPQIEPLSVEGLGRSEDAIDGGRDGPTSPSKVTLEELAKGLRRLLSILDPARPIPEPTTTPRLVFHLKRGWIEELHVSILAWTVLAA